MANQAAQSHTTAPLEPKPKSGSSLPLPRSLGPLNYLSRAADTIAEIVELAYKTVREILLHGVNTKDLLQQMASIGADSIWIVLIVTVATGAVFAYYTAALSLQIGFTRFVGGTLAYAFLNELGPVLGGVAFAARAGSAITAEIGTMVVTEQVDALRAMAVSPIRYLVVPRVLAAVIMLPLLIVLADLTGIMGGYFFSGMNGIPHAEFLNSVYEYTRVVDLTRGLTKATVFALIVSLVACQQGLRTNGGATGVGRATTSCVVLCVVLIFVSDFFLTQLLSGGTVRRR